MNKGRLLAAADWAENNIDPDKFHMSSYRRDKDHKSPICNTVGCMVGHLTAMDAQNVLKNYIKEQPIGVYGYIKENLIDFFNWSADYFDLDLDEWDFLFSQRWAIIDDTLQGAIARMRRLANGMTDEELNEELNKI